MATAQPAHPGRRAPQLRPGVNRPGGLPASDPEEAGQPFPGPRPAGQAGPNLLLAEIAADLENACRDYPKLMNALRQFAGRYLSSEEPHQSVLGIVSARHGEGRTTVALGLASSLAEMFSSVVLVEMEDEAEGPLLCEELGIPLGVGVADYLTGKASLEQILIETGRPNLKLVANGKGRLGGGRLESTGRVRKMLAELRTRFDVVIVDLPPVLEDEQAPALISQLDALVLVVNAGTTTTDDVNLTAELCEAVPLRGILLNRLESRTPKWLATLVRS